MKENKCKKCPYYGEADGCHYYVSSMRGYKCYRKEDVARWTQTIVSLTALIISIIALVIRLAR